MPIGVIVNALSVVVGSVFGTGVGKKLSEDFKTKLNMILSCCSFAMGISSICLMKNMPPVIFSIIVGTSIGLAIHLGDWIQKGAIQMNRVIMKLFGRGDGAEVDKEFTAAMITVIVLFCASGTGIYGSIVAGMEGDHSILLAKSVLDLPTAMIFSCSMGIIVAFIAIPQCLIFLLLFFLAGIIFPLTTPEMIGDFKACGGVLLIATGFRMAKLKDYPIADMIPAMIMVMPMSWLWVNYILPLVS
mgnify:FL=1